MKRGLDTAAAAVVSTVGSAFLLATALSQHPNRAFDRLRSLDRIGFAIPNWRFFAPEPAMNDYHVLHRVLDDNEVEGPWEETHHVTERKLLHLVWFPDRRRDKALFDAVSDLVALLGGEEKAILESPPYRVLRAFVRRRIEEAGQASVQGFQFLLARSAGYDDSVPPEEILTSPFVPWKGTRDI